MDIYRFAIPQGWADKDPAEHLTDPFKPKPRTRNMARVDMDELPQFVRAIDRYDGSEMPKWRAVTSGALLFTLTWAHNNEPRLAKWDEFDGLGTPDPIRRVPAARMKTQREQYIGPLLRQLSCCWRLLKLSAGSYVFAGDKLEKPISQNTMIYEDYRMGYRGRQTVHGFRGIASTWANEAEYYRPDWLDMALAHAERDEVREAYNSALYQPRVGGGFRPERIPSWG